MKVLKYLINCYLDKNTRRRWQKMRTILVKSWNLILQIRWSKTHKQFYVYLLGKNKSELVYTGKNIFKVYKFIKLAITNNLYMGVEY